jgi:hypothetical protein
MAENGAEVFRSRAEALAALDRAMRWREESRGGLSVSNPVTPAIARGLIEAVPDEVAAALVVPESYDRGPGPAALRATAVNLTGPAGAFALRVIVADAWGFQDSPLLLSAPTWSEEDWLLRLGALLDAGTERMPILAGTLLHQHPPRAAAPAQCRLVLRWAWDEKDQSLRKVAANLRAVRSGDAARDAELFAWDVARERPLLLRWLLELAGGAGEREPVVDAAEAAGLVGSGLTAQLRRPLDRPSWAEEEVPWEIAEVREGEAIMLAADGLVVGDPIAPEESEQAFAPAVPAGRHAFSVVIARHPHHPWAGAGALDVVVADGPPVRWELMGVGSPDNGVLCVSRTGAIPLQDELERLYTYEPSWVPVLDDEGGLAVCVRVVDRHAECTMWIGRDAAGVLVRVVIDLGLLGLDLVADPVLPWT